MAERFPIQVKYDDFAAAVSRLPRMRPSLRGKTRTVPNDTLLTPDREGIMVETPAVSSLVLANIPWTLNVSVDARKLVTACNNLKKSGQPDRT